MKVHVTDNVELRDSIREALKKNEGFCPCVLGSKGKQEYRCMCENFINNTPVGESCHCGLYIKEEQ